MDAYGRTMQGLQPITVRIGYTYQAVYQTPANFQQSFAALSGVPITGSRARQEVTLWQEWVGLIGLWDNRGQGLGGWTMGIHHAYDPADGTVYYGDVTSHNAQYAFGTIITTVAGGTGTQGYSGDGGPATQARLNFPQGDAVGRDGSLYIADSGNNRIRWVGTDGIITTVAGGLVLRVRELVLRVTVVTGAGNQARLNSPTGVAVGGDGSLYIADSSNNRIRHG